MKRYLVFGSISIVFLLLFIAASLVRIDVAIFQSNEVEVLSLDAATYNYEFIAPDNFNALAIRLLTYNKVANKRLSFIIRGDVSGNVLVEHTYRGFTPHGQFYKFNFSKLKKGKYLLEIKAEKGIPYKIQGLLRDKNKGMLSNLTEKIYSKKSISSVINTASLRAAKDWFKLGKLYYLSIVAYFLLISIVITISAWGLSVEKE